MVTGTEARVCADIEQRQQLGIAKYGTTVESNPLPLREWLNHQYQELLDAAIYCRKAIEDEQPGAKCNSCAHWKQGKNPLVGVFDIDCHECKHYYADKWEAR